MNHVIISYGNDFFLNKTALLISKYYKVELIQNFAPGKVFDFIGMVSYNQLIDYYSSADAYLFPSLCEGSTRAGMEAMAVGLPVILTENCGCPVKNEENGLLVPIKDAECRSHSSGGQTPIFF